MNVNEFLEALEPDKKVSINEIKVVDEYDNKIEVELIRMYSGDGATIQLSPEILSRKIEKIYILGKTFIKIHLSPGTDDV